MIDEKEVFADPTMEETAVVFLLSDIKNVQDNRISFDTSLLESRRYRALWEAACSYYDKYQGILDNKGLEVMLDEAQVSTDKKADYLLLFSGIKSKKAERSQFLLAVDQLKVLAKKRRLYDLASHVASELKSGRADVDKLTQDVVVKVLGLDAQHGTVFRERSMPETFDERLNEYLDREKFPGKYIGIPFGIKKLDELTSGIFPEEFALFFGGPASGKSRSLASIAYNMFESGHHVMYVTIEMPMAQVGRLFDSRDHMVSATGLRKGRLSEAEKKKYMSPKARKNKGDFYVVDAPQGCSAMSLISVIRRYKMRFPLDVVVLDYLNLMQPSDKSFDRNEALRIGNIGRELKSLARLERVAVLSAAQSVRDAVDLDDVSEVGSQHVGWSYTLPYQCDLMIYLQKPDPAAALAKTMDAMVVKFRDGSNYKISLGFDWDKTFVGDRETFLRLSGAFVEPNPAGPKVEGAPTC